MLLAEPCPRELPLGRSVGGNDGSMGTARGRGDHWGGAGGNGGSGIVVIRYEGSPSLVSVTGGIVTNDGDYTVCTFTSSGTLTVNSASTTHFFFDAGKRWRTVQAPTASETDPDRITYAYTGTGRLAEYVKYEGGAAATQAAYTYDSVGQRTRSVVTKDGAETTTDFTYTGLTLHKLSAAKTQGETSESWSITYLYDEYGKPYAGVYRDTTGGQPTGQPRWSSP